MNAKPNGCAASPVSPNDSFHRADSRFYTDSARLLAGVHQGDARAADELFRRYVDRLVGLARKGLSSRLGARIDPEDIVQSAYQAFFARAEKGQFSHRQSGDLWRILSAIAVNKLRRQVARNQAAKRDMTLEHLLETSSAKAFDPHSTDPMPSAVVAAKEEEELLMNGLNSFQRRMLQMRFEGYTLDEIAAELGYSERTVRRLLDTTRQRLKLRLAELAIE
jgi:RNA polymerase sigma factor (sigma-70 family)